jgi:hypothetical protein
MCVRGIQFSSIPSRKHCWHLALPVHKQRRREAITDSSLSGAWRLSLAEGIGRAGGLADAQADPASIFLYRGETREVAQLLGIDCTPYPGPIIPGYLQSQLAGSRRLFLASKFEMRNKDVIYASNSLRLVHYRSRTHQEFAGQARMQAPRIVQVWQFSGRTPTGLGSLNPATLGRRPGRASYHADVVLDWRWTPSAGPRWRCADCGCTIASAREGSDSGFFLRDLSYARRVSSAAMEICRAGTSPLSNRAI